MMVSLEELMMKDNPYLDFNQLGETHFYYNIVSSVESSSDMIQWLYLLTLPQTREKDACEK